MGHDRDSDDVNEHDFQDMMWAAFQNCWHVKDWIMSDPNVSDAQKQAVLAMAHQSPDLGACQDLCNGTKHLAPDRARVIRILIQSSVRPAASLFIGIAS